MEKEQALSVSRGLKKIISEAIQELPEDKKNNKYSICEQVNSTLEKRYIGGNPNENGYYENNKLGIYNYQIKRMGIETTGQLLRKIELYMLTAAKKNFN